LYAIKVKGKRDFRRRNNNVGEKNRAAWKKEKVSPDRLPHQVWGPDPKREEGGTRPSPISR